MRVIRNDADLAPGKADRFNTTLRKCHTEQRHRYRSPVVSNMSISRPGCTVDTSFASFSKLSVDLPIAETTTTTSAPCCRVYATWSATARMRSGSATEVPPYFWTMSVTRSTAYGCHEPSATVSETTSNSRSDAPVATGCSDFASPDPSSVWVCDVGERTLDRCARLGTRLRFPNESRRSSDRLLMWVSTT